LYTISHEEIKRDEDGERHMPTIVHFEIPSDDIERSKKFYNELFGWMIETFSKSDRYRTVPNYNPPRPTVALLVIKTP